MKDNIPPGKYRYIHRFLKNHIIVEVFIRAGITYVKFPLNVRPVKLVEIQDYATFEKIE